MTRTTQNHEPEFLTPEQVADLLQVSVRRVHEMRRAGTLVAISLTGGAAKNATYRFPRAALYEALGLEGGR